MRITCEFIIFFDIVYFMLKNFMISGTIIVIKNFKQSRFTNSQLHFTTGVSYAERDLPSESFSECSLLQNLIINAAPHVMVCFISEKFMN
jgi:hypothetical protein